LLVKKTYATLPFTMPQQTTFTRHGII